MAIGLFYHKLGVVVLHRVSKTLLICSCIQSQVLVSTVLRCGLIGGHKSSEMKSGVSKRMNSTVERALCMDRHNTGALADW